MDRQADESLMIHRLFCCNLPLYKSKKGFSAVFVQKLEKRLLKANQRNILWVSYLHAGHHELCFLILRQALSCGKDVNACPSGWQKDFDVFRGLFNWCEG